MTGVHEEFTHCSPTTNLGQHEKSVYQSTATPHWKHPYDSQKTPNFVGLSAVSNNSVDIHNNINQISKFSKSLTTTMPTFDGKYEMLQLIEDLFQTNLNLRNLGAEYDRINYFHFLMRGDALQTFNNTKGPTQKNLETSGSLPEEMRKKSLDGDNRTQNQEIVFNPMNQIILDFLKKLQKLAKEALKIAANSIIEQFIYSITPKEMNKSGPLGDWLKITNCHTLKKGIQPQWFASY